LDAAGGKSVARPEFFGHTSRMLCRYAIAVNLLAWCAAASALAGPVVYDGAVGDGTQTPADQGSMIYLPPSNAAPVSAGGGRTTIDSLANTTLKGGFFSHVAFPPFVPLTPINAAWPTLNAANGFTVRLDAQIAAEAHNTNDRAGFNLIMIASNQRGVELGFWTSEVWCQEGGVSPQLFTHAEGVMIDTTTPRRYELSFRGSRYQLYIDNRLRLSGNLRDYTAFNASGSGLPFNPYTTQSFLFVGDDTSSAGATASFTRIEIIDAARCGPADVAKLGGALGFDGVLSVDDLIAYLGAFFGGNATIGDIATLGGANAPDGQITADDLIAFLTAFFAGC
jgi:hypothetical protein